MKNPTQLPRKTFQEAGKWIEKPTKTFILMCACGVKYIKTRKDQTTCIKCFTRRIS